MSIDPSSYTSIRYGNLIEVTVVSDLSGTIYYHWYLDGIFLAQTQAANYSFWLSHDDQARVEVFDTNDPFYDGPGNAPSEHPGRQTIWWVRSTNTDIVSYRVEQKKGAGDWVEIAEVPQDDRQWTHQVLSRRLDDLGEYQWRVIPIGSAGNAGTILSIPTRTVVRRPDAPDFDIAFDSGTTKVTFSEAA